MNEITTKTKQQENEYFKTTLTVQFSMLKRYEILKAMGVVGSWGDCTTAGILFHEEVLNLPKWLKHFKTSQESTNHILKTLINRLESMQNTLVDVGWKIRKLEDKMQKKGKE